MEDLRKEEEEEGGEGFKRRGDLAGRRGEMEDSQISEAISCRAMMMARWEAVVLLGEVGGIGPFGRGR